MLEVANVADSFATSVPSHGRIALVQYGKSEI
jgi:hypothetical protein